MLFTLWGNPVYAGFNWIWVYDVIERGQKLPTYDSTIDTTPQQPPFARLMSPQSITTNQAPTVLTVLRGIQTEERSSINAPVNSTISDLKTGITGIPRPQHRLVNIAENSTDIIGIAKKNQANTKSQQILTKDINTVTYLDESNVVGSPGDEHWDINEPGTYILTYNQSVISTNHKYAVFIHVSNVIFDGNHKTITGPGIGTDLDGPSYYGIRVNSGGETANVTVKNVTVSNKNFGVIYEWIRGGGISTSQLATNNYGIYTWKCSNLTIQSNSINSNNYGGIVLDADQSTNDYFTIDSNNVYANGTYGIHLWLSNNHNVINNNQVNDNNMGIVLDGQTAGSGTGNTISNNTVTGNVNGIYVMNYHGNRMIDNTLFGNSNVAVWMLQSSSGNQFTGNYVQESGWVGMSLTNSVNENLFYNNVFKNYDNEYSDGTVFNNQWNINPVAGVNIVGGPNIGGNYWSNGSSTGFSDTQPDSNFDGFCDQPYNHPVGLIDNYPLKTILNNALFTRNTIPSKMVQGKSYPITITVMNTGTATWDSSYALGSVSDSMGDAAKFGPLRIGIPTDTTVAPFQSYTFSFLMTPSVTGTLMPKYQMVQSNWFGQILSKQITVTPVGFPWMLLLLQ